MENSLIVCGGTGAHTAAAFLRLHILGYPLGFFERAGKPMDFPSIFLVDQDAGDGAEREPTAWQLVRRLVDSHPGRFNWSQAIGRADKPELVQATPLPVGPNHGWFRRPYNRLGSRFEGSAVLDLLASERQRDIDYSKGMMGSPSVGSLLFRLKDYDEQSKELNCDEKFGQLLDTRGRVVVSGSGVGGTGAAVVPTLAQRLAQLGNNQVMAVVLLNWFEFDEEGQDETIRSRAAYRNRVMRENANSALEFYGQTLARRVAAVPVGMPERNLSKRRFTGDVGQPIHESFIHAVGALSSYRHFLNEQAYRPGLYLMGAVERGRLDGATAIPGGTLHGLAHQATTLVSILEAYRDVLSQAQDGRVQPAIYKAVAAGAEPRQVADHLEQEIRHYREQVDWLNSTLNVEGRTRESFLYEAAARKRLSEGQDRLEIAPDAPPERAASALLHWAARWVRSEASPEKQLEIQPGPVGGAHWPDLRNADGLGISPKINGDLDRIDDSSRDQVLEAFVDPEYLSCNGWPHPLSSVEYFRQAIRRRDEVAVRQLELLLVGLVSEELKVVHVHVPNDASGLSLERLIGEARRDGYDGLVELKVVWPRRGDLPVAFNSPYTLLCPTAEMFEEDGEIYWNELWRLLSGAADGADWREAEAPATWGEHDLAVRQVRSWIEQQKRVFAGSSPPWTKVFADYRGREQSVPFGTGDLIKIFWGSSSDPNRAVVDINLPTQQTGLWVPPPGTPSLEEKELFEKVPELLAVKDEQGEMLYEMVEFEVPGREGKLRGWWDVHLEHLRSLDKIYIWSRDEHGQVILGTMEPSGLFATTLTNSRLLSRDTVAIKSCAPIEQDPVPGSNRRAGELLFPDLPIRSDYFDLVETPEGEHLLDRMKKAVPPGDGWRPKSRNDAGGNLRVEWTLNLRGRREPLAVALVIPNSGPSERAHWMVWPNLRTRKAGKWKAYYIYEWSENRQHTLETLWLKAHPKPHLEKLVQPKRGPNKSEIITYPIGYQSGTERNHVGGPPLAFCLRHHKRDEELGLYLVDLKLVGGSPAQVNLAIDFGTSHSVAAVQIGSDPPQPIKFYPELRPEEESLSLHISENSEHVFADEKNNGLLAKGSWVPTYTSEDNQGFLPSELMLYRPLEEAQADAVDDWIPGTHYLIPPMDIGREELGKYILADFKWDTGVSHFRGREQELREAYLAMFLELTLAEMVAHHLRGFPDQQVNLTFTYPLRSRKDQVEALQGSLEETASRSSKSLGLVLGLQSNIGIYDESRAAQLRTENIGEVVLVGDLGGGTLDLFISATTPRTRIPEVADSARLGGNLLLRQIAETPQGILPSDGGWAFGNPRDTEAKLRAWMRSHGSARLFGVDAGGRVQLPRVGVVGFGKASQAEKARVLLNRYFLLIVEYLARNLAAYLYSHWFPNVADENLHLLKLSVQLRGNGWRLRYQGDSYESATEAIQDLVRQRVTELWGQIPGNHYPNPGTEAEWPSANTYQIENPKIAPILSVVGQAMSFEDVMRNWHTHTLVELNLRRDNGQHEMIDWHRKIPFETGGSKRIEIANISPPFVLSSQKEDKKFEISSLKATSQGNINKALQGSEGAVDAGEYRAPVAPLVWETVFNSRTFWPGKEDN